MACFVDRDPTSSLFRQFIVESFGAGCTLEEDQECGEGSLVSPSPDVGVRPPGLTDHPTAKGKGHVCSITPDPSQVQHRERVTPIGHNSVENLIMVHEAVPIKDAKLIPEAAKALQVEWDKLHKLGAWDLGSVREMDELKSCLLYTSPSPRDS